MKWFTIKINLTLDLLDITYNYLWNFSNGLKLEKISETFVINSFIYDGQNLNKIVTNLNRFLRFNAKSLNTKIPSLKIKELDSYDDNDFIIVPYPSLNIPPFGIKIFIQRGRSFGIGSHPCTYYCLCSLKEIQKISPEKIIYSKILDAGAGTGILSIATAKIGAKKVVGIDISPEAILEAEENKRLNNVADRITFLNKSVTEINDEYDIILANLYGKLHLEIGEYLCKKINPDGYIVIGGMNTLQSDEILQIYHKHGLIIKKIFNDEQWYTAILHRR